MQVRPRRGFESTFSRLGRRTTLLLLLAAALASTTQLAAQAAGSVTLVKASRLLDPRSGQPVENALLAAVVLPSATETDAFSTALLIAGENGHDKIADLRPKMKTLVMSGMAGEGNLRLKSRGIGNEQTAGGKPPSSV